MDQNTLPKTITLDHRRHGFIDFGCGSGGSLRKFGKIFKSKGLGIDIRERKIEIATKNGHDAIRCNALETDFTGKVRFGIMNHFTEHLPNPKEADILIRKAIKSIKRFLIIIQPFFDADPYLFSKGLKFYWSNWHGHQNKMTQLDFYNTLAPLKRNGKIEDFALYGRTPITSSSDPSILSIDAPINSKEWTPSTGTPKPEIPFTDGIYRELLVFVKISQTPLARLEKFLRPSQKLYPREI